MGEEPIKGSPFCISISKEKTLLSFGNRLESPEFPPEASQAHFDSSPLPALPALARFPTLLHMASPQDSPLGRRALLMPATARWSVTGS